MNNNEYQLGLSSDEANKLIRELENANEKLQASNLRMSSYFDNAPDGVFVCDENGNYKETNPAASKITGYSKKELLNMSIKDLTPEDSLEIAFKNFMTLKETGSSNGEVKFLHKSGEIRWWSINAVKLTETSYLGFVKDITDNKKTKDDLIQNEKRLNMIFQTLSEGVALNEIVYDDNGDMIDYKILDVNDAFFKIANYNKDVEVIGNFATKLYNMDRQFIKYFWDNHKDKINPVSTEYFDPISNKYYIISTSPFIDNKFVTSFYDISNRKLTEEKLITSKQRLKDAQSVAKIGSWETDLNTFEVIWSDETYNIFELSKNDFSNSHPNFINYVHPDDRANVDSALLNSFSSYDINKVEHRIITPSKNLKIVEETWRVFHDSEGKAIKALGTCQDITDRKEAEEKLKQSAEFTKLVADSTDGMIGYWNKNLICEFANKNYYDWFGISKEQMIGIRVQDLLGEELFRKNEPYMLNALKGEIQNFERELIKSNGENIVLWVKYFPHSIDGVIEGLFVSIIDITERKKVEEKIKESEVRFKNIIDLSPVPYALNDDELNIIDLNKSFIKTFGYDLSDIPTVADWWPKAYPDPIYREFIEEEWVRRLNKSLIDNTEFEPLECYICCKDGTYKTVIVEASSLIEIINGTHLVIFYDITERKEAELKIREKDIQFKKLSANIPDLIYQFTRRTDGSYYVPIASEGIINIFGCTPEDVLEDFAPIANVIYPEDVARVTRDIEYSAKHLTYFTCEFRVQIQGKPIQWIFSRSNPEKMADGSITWYGFNADITERKKVELELIKAKDKAEESDRLKTSFLANMSHEIRTPMNGILGFTNLLKEPNLTGEDKDDFIDMIERSGTRMLSTINDVIDISKIEAGLIEVSISNTNINEQIIDRYAFFLPETSHKGLTLTYHHPLNSADAIIKTDNDKLYAILTNLIKNAIKFTSEGSIDFGYELKSDFIEFYVKDTGDGIDKEKLELIFERFRQGSESLTRDYEGSGLGLTISKAYVQMLGGKIWLKSELGKGTEFYFTIPYVNVKKNINTNINIMKIQAFEKDFRKLNILIAEDDETSQILLTMTLKNHTGNLIIAKNGVQAVEACRNHPDLDVILMDIKMPIMNGYEATKKIREFNKDILIIGQSAYALTGDKELALSVGLNEYMTKPLDIYSLIELLYKYFKD